MSLRGLPPLMVVEVLFGLQQRSRHGAKTPARQLRPLVNELRRQQVTAVAELTAAVGNKRSIAGSITRHVAAAFLDPETERVKNVWEMAAFGLTGRLVFTGIRQRWLRQAAKQWAAQDLPRRRGVSTHVTTSVQGYLHCVARLSQTLYAARPDHGEMPTVLGRADIETFLQRLAYLASTGQNSQGVRTRICRKLKSVLGSMRAFGLMRLGGPAVGLPKDFTLTIADIPAPPEAAEPGRDLPPEIMQQLCAHLPDLQHIAGRQMRVAIGLIIDTGQRPEEICRLAWDCLTRDADGKPVLIYDNRKANRTGRRLPIPDETASLISKQKKHVRARFPDTPLAELKLLPSPHANPHGQRSIREISVSGLHRDWVNALPMLRLSDGTEFDKACVFPYAYRHTYAQRHADAGVPAEVLRELMDHRMFETIKQYFNVGDTRRRDAVDRVAVMQFDQHGNRIWRQAKTLLDSDHVRRVVGQVVLPFGVCAEPANVKAGGGACPYRFRCVGCDHFRTDVSYLPDLQAHLDDLLRNRERLHTAADLDPWAKTEAMPSDEEITRIRRLIGRIKTDLDQLTADEHAQVEHAVATIRRHRTVMLGMPHIAQPLPDTRPDRNFA